MQEGNPLVSIIMPTYNRAGYILETIACIIAQTYANWELLVLDDGSTDNTETLVTTVVDNRIKYHKFGRTGITGKLKNIGIRESKGKLIAFMDSDDLWPVDKLEKQVKALLEHPKAGFSFTNGFNFTEPDKPEEYFYPVKEDIECRNVFLDFCTANIGIRTPTILFLKYCIDKTGFFNETRLFTDYSFIGKLSYSFEAVILNEPLFHRRLHPGNNFNSNSYEDYLEYFETIESFISEKKLTLKIVQQTLFISHIRAGDILVSMKCYQKSVPHYLKAWHYKWYSLIPLKRIFKIPLGN